MRRHVESSAGDTPPDPDDSIDNGYDSGRYSPVPRPVGDEERIEPVFISDSDIIKETFTTVEAVELLSTGSCCNQLSWD